MTLSIDFLTGKTSFPLTEINVNVFSLASLSSMIVLFSFEIFQNNFLLI